MEGKKEEEKEKEEEKNNAKFSGHYVYPCTETVRAHALRSHQYISRTRPFNLLTEEAFLFNSLREVTKVWVLIYVSTHFLKNFFTFQI